MNRNEPAVESAWKFDKPTWCGATDIHVLALQWGTRKEPARNPQGIRSGTRVESAVEPAWNPRRISIIQRCVAPRTQSHRVPEPARNPQGTRKEPAVNPRGIREAFQKKSRGE